MKMIHKHNFFSTVCEIYTLLVLGKLLLEYIAQGIWENYQGNLLIMFVLSLASTFVLSQYYRFQKYPLSVVIVVQYLVLVGAVMLFTWVSGFYEPLHENGYRDMFLSFSIPYAIGVAVYYVAMFHEIKKVNRALQEMKDKKPARQKGDKI